MIILAQALNGILLPFAAVFLLLVVNDRALMGREAVNGPRANALMGAVVAVTIVLGVAGVFRAGATAAGLPPPGEGLLLGVAATVAAVLSIPIVRRIMQKGDPR